MDRQVISKELKSVSDMIFSHGSPWTIEQFFDQINQENTMLIEKRVDGKLIGFALSQFVLDEAELLLIGIIPNFRQHGIASQLLSELIQQLQGIDVTRLFLEVRKKNKQAINFYEKHHLIQIGVRKNYYKNPLDDALIMQLDL